MQKTIDILFSLLDEIKRDSKKRYARELLMKIIDHINKQDVIIERLRGEKIGISKNNKVYDEVEKYTIVLMLYGFTHFDIQAINSVTLDFLLRHKDSIKEKPTVNQIINSQFLLFIFIDEFGREPNTIEELNNYYTKIQNVKSTRKHTT